MPNQEYKLYINNMSIVLDSLNKPVYYKGRRNYMKVKDIVEKKDLEDAFNIRKAVFVREQGVPLDNELDEYEDISNHILVYYENKPVATGRLRIVDNIGKLERICVIIDYRKYGLGKVVVEGLEKLAREKGIKKTKLHAQVQAKGFYEKVGYIQVSGEFMEENILHIAMTKDL